MTVHYHGTPITPLEQLDNMAGFDFCISYAHPQDLRWCLKNAQQIMFDNGAFSIWTKGGTLDVDGYNRWLAPILRPPHFAVIPDVIGGSVEENNALIDAWPRAWDHVGAPVWHLNEPLEQLLDLVGAGWQRVCFGSAGEYRTIGTAAWCRRMDEAFNELQHEYGPVLPWIHGLRMMDQMDRWPLASVDSTNVAQNWKRDTGCARCKAEPINARQVPSDWTLQPIQQGLLT